MRSSLTRTPWTPVLAAVFLQGALVLVGGLGAAWLQPAWAPSLLAGGLAIWVPNIALAAYLAFRASIVRVLGLGVILAGEGLKVAVSIALLVGFARTLGTATVWPALVLGVVIALKGQWLALWVTK